MQTSSKHDFHQTCIGQKPKPEQARAHQGEGSKEGWANEIFSSLVLCFHGLNFSSAFGVLIPDCDCNTGLVAHLVVSQSCH